MQKQRSPLNTQNGLKTPLFPLLTFFSENGRTTCSHNGWKRYNHFEAFYRAIWCYGIALVILIAAHLRRRGRALQNIGVVGGGGPPPLFPGGGVGWVCGVLVAAPRRPV